MCTALGPGKEMMKNRGGEGGGGGGIEQNIYEAKRETRREGR